MASSYISKVAILKYIACIVLLVGVVYKPPTATAAQMTVGDLYKVCTSSKDADKTACTFYILGVFEGVQIGGATVQEKSGRFQQSMVKVFCVPDNLQSSAMQAIVKMKMGADIAVYPHDRDLPAVSFITAIIGEEFPCQPTK
jgi:hypothetical protein